MIYIIRGKRHNWDCYAHTFAQNERKVRTIAKDFAQIYADCKHKAATAPNEHYWVWTPYHEVETAIMDMLSEMERVHGEDAMPSDLYDLVNCN